METTSARGMLDESVSFSTYSEPFPLKQLDILNALERQITSLEREADRLASEMNYDAEFAGEDARMLRQVADLISSNGIHLLATPDPMDAPLPCQIQIGHIKIGAGVPLSVLHEHAKRMYRLAYGQDADEVENEPLETRRARGDTILAALRASSLEADGCTCRDLLGGDQALLDVPNDCPSCGAGKGCPF